MEPFRAGAWAALPIWRQVRKELPAEVTARCLVLARIHRAARFRRRSPHLRARITTWISTPGCSDFTPADHCNFEPEFMILRPELPYLIKRLCLQKPAP